MFLMGGAISLVISIVFFQLVPLSSENASFAAFCEEPGKLLALSIFLRKQDKRYGLNGILVGGAIGAGFAAIESLGYGAAYGVSNVLLRGVLAPGGHVVWAAIYGGALALAKGREPLRTAHFANPMFLGCFGISVALHFAWNSGISLMPLPVFGDLFHVLLTVAAWAALFWVMSRGVRQVVAITNSYGMAWPAGGYPPAFPGAAEQAAARESAYGQPGFASPVPPPPARAAAVVCLNGVYAGQIFSLEPGTMVFGREPSLCGLVFPTDLAGISRKHCALEYQNGCFYLWDCNFSFGTFLGNGRRLGPGERVQLFSGHQFYMGNERFEVRG